MSRQNARYRIAHSREQAIEFVNAVFDSKLLNPEAPDVLFIASDLRQKIDVSKGGKSNLIAEFPGRFAQIWEPDETGHYMKDRPEQVCYRVISKIEKGS